MDQHTALTYDPARPFHHRRVPKNPGAVVRNVNLALDDDARFTAIQKALTGSQPGDVPSFSLVCRRALTVYARQVEALLNDPWRLEEEKRQVARSSRLLRLRKKPNGVTR
jgi:hypothetical protein